MSYSGLQIHSLTKGAIYSSLLALKAADRSGFAVLADPDKTGPEAMPRLAKLCNDAGVDYLLMGGSLLLAHRMEECIKMFKSCSRIPVILFPGSPAQVSREANALLYLSLLSGRNADLLIGQHVVSAPVVRDSGLEVISTGYILVDGGVPTTVSYISNTTPIPADKPDIALCTAWAGEMQGKHIIYLDAGSGALNPVDTEMVRVLSSQLTIPLFVGGGIRTPEKVYERCIAGASVVIIGNAIEKDSSLIFEMASAVKTANRLAGLAVK